MREDIYLVTPRKPLTPKQKLKLFVDKKGVCCVCGGKIESVKEAWDEHVISLADGGTNDETNRDVAHDKCARSIKTPQEAKERAHLRRAALRHFGAKKASKGRPMPGTKASGWKKKLDGTVVRREK